MAMIYQEKSFSASTLCVYPQMDFAIFLVQRATLGEILLDITLFMALKDDYFLCIFQLYVDSLQ